MRRTLVCFGLGVLLLVPFGATGQDSASDTPVTVTPPSISSHIGVSPFDPPAEDVFVVDVGPELDTGCTFNNDPIAPLDIEIVIDRAAGPVDADGYLEDPEPLIAAGIIPSSILITMPAWDVDYDGLEPPERDEVWLNGRGFLGYLWGENDSWELNAFTVGIDRIKFPAPPAPGSTLAPAINTIQIVIDTLSNGRQCTSIDWVAFHIPIHPKVALTLEPKPGNRVRQNNSEDTIDTIFEQSLDADCSLTTEIGDHGDHSDYDEYPFFAPSSANARLHAAIAGCPSASLVTPLVKVDWAIGVAGISGTTEWTGLEGDIYLTTPAQVGAYIVRLSFDIGDGAAIATVNRKLFVTKSAPQTQVEPPRRTWLEKGTAWASGFTDQTDILEGVLAGLYSYGNANWRFGYYFGAAEKCSWEQLVADPVVCNYGDSHTFSYVFQNISAVLGIFGLSTITTAGSEGFGLLTVASPSLDPAFPGNAKPLGGGDRYDRYLFAGHGLTEKGGLFYDATFGRIYASETEIVAANLDGGWDIDANGIFETTVEGIKVYPKPGSIYDSWGNSEYVLASRSSQYAPTTLGGTGTEAAEIGFTGSATYVQIDPSADGLADNLVANVDVEVLAPGVYTILGLLEKNGEVVANRPRLESSLRTRANVTEPVGVHTVSLEFSGEQISRSGEDGPYDLRLFATGGSSPATAVLATPTFDHGQFGELPPAKGITDKAVDGTGDRPVRRL